MNTKCELVLIECLPCNDDPIRNITAEAPDVDVFIGFEDFRGIPPIGVLYAQIGCKQICFSTTSQRDADDCAKRQAALCAWNTWRPPRNPAIPPGPNGKPGGGTPTTPGGIPPSNPRNNRLPTFPNKAQECTASCPDGTPFVEEIPAGTIVDLTQIAADEKAAALACKRAEEDKLCINSSTIPGVCVGSAVNFTFQATGGLQFSDGSYLWNYLGDLPAGVTLDQSTGLLSGTPTQSGNSVFEVEVIDANGHSTSRTVSICVMEIVTEATLPNATEGDDYTQPLLEEPGDVSSEQWTLVSGSLPSGLTLNAAGSITGNPDPIDTGDPRDFTFTLKCVATCGGSQVTCQKQFTLTVDPGVDCMGNAEAVQDLTWSSVGPAGTLTIAGGDGTFVSNLNSIALVGNTTLCNPSSDAYDVTFTFNWTQTTNFTIDGQPIVRLNGVDHSDVVHNGNGAFSFAVTLSLPSGVNTIQLRFNGSGIFITNWTGTITVRPLTPP